MQFANNWSQALTLAPGATSCALDLPDGTYRLTLADSLAAATRREIVEAAIVAGTATLTRAQEGTTDQDWPDGSVIYCGMTAGLLADLFARIGTLETTAATQAQQISDLTARVEALEPVEPLTVTSASTTTNPTGIYGYGPAFGAGAISPEGATVYPDGRLSIDGVGELMELCWSYDYPHYGSLVMRVRGNSTDWPSVESLPFNSVTIGSIALSRAALTAAGTGEGFMVFQWTGIDNPFVDGDNAVVFA